MKRFIARYRPFITGVLSGFDRLVFRGSLLPLFRDGGLLGEQQVDLSDPSDIALLDASRQLRLVRAHGVIHKISKTHRYRLTRSTLDSRLSTLDSQLSTLNSQLSTLNFISPDSPRPNNESGES